MTIQTWSEQINRDHAVYQNEVKLRNRNALNAFLLCGIASFAVMIIAELVIARLHSFHYSLIILAYILAVWLIDKVMDLPDSILGIPVLYIVQEPLLLFTAYMGTAYTVNDNAILFFLLLLILPMFILDKPFHIVGYIAGNSLVFMILCMVYKDGSMLQEDIIYSLVAFSTSAGVNLINLNDRLSAVKGFSTLKVRTETDTLTGALSSDEGRDRIYERIENNVPGMFVIFDIDNFKQFNDTYGHLTGDIVLRSVSECINSCLSENDTMMRFGGDEFITYITEVQDVAKGRQKLAEIIYKVNHLSVPECEGKQVRISAGAVINDGSCQNYDVVFKEADKCLYQAKSGGKNRYRYTSINEG